MDINVFLPGDQAGRALDALPAGVKQDAETLSLTARDGQARLWWEHTPLDLFFNTTAFHEQAAPQTRTETFTGGPSRPRLRRPRRVAYFDRSKDWLDLEAMAEAGALDVASVAGVLAEYLGPHDARVERVLALG